MSNEIELKLRIAAADVARLSRHPALLRHLAEPPLTRRLTSIYFDTSDLQLLDVAISLRVRHMAGGWFQAVKGAGHSLAGLHQRMEWEDVISGDTPDFDKITEPGLAAIFAAPALRSALRPIFITDVERTEWQLVFADGSAIEAALDLGELQPGAGSADWPHENICELELELKRGNASHIFELALALQADIPLQIENISKAQRGYAHFRRFPSPIAPPPLPDALPAGTTAELAFRQLASLCLQHLQDGHTLLRTDAQPLALAVMRRALERLRFLLKLFRLQQNEIRKALKQAIALLDIAFDWHTLVHETLPALSGNLPSSEHKLLQQQSDARLTNALQRLEQRLDSQGQHRLLLQVGACLTATVPQPHHPAEAILGPALQRDDLKLRKLAEHLPETSGKQLRKLLRRIGRLRYSAALLAMGADAAAEEAYLKGLTEIETALTMLYNARRAAALSQRLLHDNKDSGTTLDRLGQWHAAPLASAIRICQSLPALPLP